MRKSILGLIILLPILMSCDEDEERVIQTDLSTEAAEMFSISTDWNESLYFAMISWEEYQQMDTVGLPGCPDIYMEEETKEVTLQFPSSTDCIQTGAYGRSGKLIIKFDTTLLSPARRWTMEYADYYFGTNSIEGIRTYSSDDSLQISEEFTEIIERTENELTTVFSGKFVHAKTFLSDTLEIDSLAADSSLFVKSLSSFTSLGSIKGVNAAGRDFEITVDTPITHAITCYAQNEILPSTGMETWSISRGGNSRATYSVTYEPQIEDCKVSANATLPDGKKLLLNPTE